MSHDLRVQGPCPLDSPLIIIIIIIVVVVIITLFSLFNDTLNTFFINICLTKDSLDEEFNWVGFISFAARVKQATHILPTASIENTRGTSIIA